MSDDDPRLSAIGLSVRLCRLCPVFAWVAGLFHPDALVFARSRIRPVRPTVSLPRSFPPCRNPGIPRTARPSFRASAPPWYAATGIGRATFRAGTAGSGTGPARSLATFQPQDEAHLGCTDAFGGCAKAPEQVESVGEVGPDHQLVERVERLRVLPVQRQPLHGPDDCEMVLDRVPNVLPRLGFAMPPPSRALACFCRSASRAVPTPPR